jgi:hypothetical protein
VFGAGGDAVGISGRALKAAHHGHAQRGGEKRIFTEALGYAAPARIARDVDHGREGPVDADFGGFARGGTRGALRERRVEARRQTERDGEDGLVTVNYVAPEDQRHAQPALERQLLHAVPLFERGRIQDGAEHARGGFVASDVVAAVAPRVLRHLPRLFGQSHLGQQRFDTWDARGGDLGLGAHVLQGRVSCAAPASQALFAASQNGRVSLQKRERAHDARNIESRSLVRLLLRSVRARVSG